MLKRTPSRNNRTYRRSKRSGRIQRPLWKWDSPHKRAIDRLALELKAEEGLLCWFHSGVTWQAVLPLIKRGTPVHVDKERTIRADGRRYIPDLTIRCKRTGQVLLLIEVWSTHAVSEAKRRAFAHESLPWIEVRAFQVLSRFRDRALPVLDWGGLPPTPPTQHALFDPISINQQIPAKTPIEIFLANWSQQLSERFAVPPYSNASAPRLPS